MDNEIWEIQKKFNEEFYKYRGTSMDEFSIEQKQYWTKEIILSIISETIEVLNSINWKMHRKEEKEVILDNLLEELVDCQKFLLGLFQIWGFSFEDFKQKFKDKSEVVYQRWKQEIKLNLLKDEQKICIVDIDGVLANYHKAIVDFVNKELNANYKFDELHKLRNYKDLKHKYRISGIKRELELMPYAKELLDYLSSKGYKIVLLSARPYKKYVRIFYDTLYWINKNNLKCDALFFDEDKSDKIVKILPQANFIIEDDLNYANSLANLGYRVFLLNNEYNQGYINTNIIRINSLKDIIGFEK